MYVLYVAYENVCVCVFVAQVSTSDWRGPQLWTGGNQVDGLPRFLSVMPLLAAED